MVIEVTASILDGRQKQRACRCLRPKIPMYIEMIIKHPLPLSEAKRSLSVSFEISKGGISGKPHPHSVNDTHYETMYVHIPRRWFYRTLVFEVRLASMEGLEKTEAIRIWRQLPNR